MSNWISVKDEMPTEDIQHLYSLNMFGHVIIASEDQVSSAYVVNGVFSLTDGTDIDNSDITHWMPLPEPPQEGCL